MGLQQDIVLINEFTVQLEPGVGSRGSKPRDFVLGYMAREDATEILAPVEIGDEGSFGLANFAMRYIARQEATEQYIRHDVDGSIPEIKQSFSKIDKLSGRAFGRQNVSLSATELRLVSDIIQRKFEDNHAVQKMVISFTEDYLKRTGVVSSSFVHNGEGSYRGQIDQLKLRQSINDGLELMVKHGRYAAPEWVGAIQVDTRMVHAHIALVDSEFSSARMMDDGYDRGKINEREKTQFRVGLNRSLMGMKSILPFQKQVAIERQNVVGYMRQYTSSEISRLSSVQVLLASLPKDRRMWRYGTHREEMKYSNQLAEGIVTRIFRDQPDACGYTDAIASVTSYIESRKQAEDIPRKEELRLMTNAQKLLVERSVNSIYATLKDVDHEMLQLRTPKIDIQSRSDDELQSLLGSTQKERSEGIDSVGFELRMRGYSSRRNTHKKMASEYKEYTDMFDSSFDDGVVSIQALAMRRFYEEELLYNMSLTDKYRKFFSYENFHDLANIPLIEKTYLDVLQTYDRLDGYYRLFEAFDMGGLAESMGYSSNVAAISNRESTNDILQQTYGVIQGSRIFDDGLRQTLESEVESMELDYTTMLRDYTFDAFMLGLATSREWRDIHYDHRDVSDNDYLINLRTHNIKPVAPYKPKPRLLGVDVELFNEVKSLDIHHLGLDFYGKIDHSISNDNIDRFQDATIWREFTLKRAMLYLSQSGQDSTVLLDVSDDIADMRDALDLALSEGNVRTADAIDIEKLSSRNVVTVTLDDEVDVIRSIHSMLEDVSQSNDNLEIINHMDTIQEVTDLEDYPENFDSGFVN